MSTTVSTIRPINTASGVQPSVDQTRWNTEHWTETYGIRFRNDTPEKKGGWYTNSFDNGNTVVGVPRSIYSQQINGKSYTMIGTHKRLYALIGSRLTNITPIDKSSSVIVGDTSTTYYDSLGINPITTENGSRTIYINNYAALYLKVGDEIDLTGLTTTNGIPDTELNATHIIRSIIDDTNFTISVSTPATSSGIGGGSSGTIASGLVTLKIADHKLSDGDRVELKDFTAFGGITTGELNKEHIIRNVTDLSFSVMTGDIATSYAVGGGVSAKYFQQISQGLINVESGQGYGMGLYGVGLYGVSKTSSSGLNYPRIWCFDRYGDYILCSPCNGGKLYEWNGDTTVAPVQVANSPDEINWFFVSDNIIVTLGAGGIENRIKTSDQSDRTNWTATAQNQVYDDAIEGAGRFITQMNVRGVNLIFTEKQVYTMEYIGFDTSGTSNVWKIRLLGVDCGICGPLARVEANGIGYWMGQNNNYFYRGGNCEIMPANTQARATNQRFVFSRLSTGQRYKTFATHNEAFEEISFHYPSNSGEVDWVSTHNITEKTWTNDNLERTAAEGPYTLKIYPKMAGYNGAIYSHEYGYDADGDSIPFSIRTNLKNAGKKEARLVAFIPDCVQSGNMTVTLRGFQWPQSDTPIQTQTFTVTPSTGRVEVTMNARYWDYEISGDVVGQSWSMGTWQEEIQQSGDGK